jgi:hypothetical protein
MRKKNEFPAGWNEQRLRDLLAHYEGQTEEEAVAEDEAALEHRTTSMVEVPIAGSARANRQRVVGRKLRLYIAVVLSCCNTAEMVTGKPHGEVTVSGGASLNARSGNNLRLAEVAIRRQ